ncbi:MAG: NAD(+) synthase [Kiritimatiellae bacterium]|nr:NAD(+) synthase [Kiritimatiellia bacterium]
MKRELGSLAKHRAYLGKPPKKGSVVPFPCDPAKVFAAQVKGLAARLKAIRCHDVVIGLSGGLDSTLALLVADAAFAKLKYDKRGIHIYAMPGFGTSRRTKGNAELLCEGLGLKLEFISIVKSVRQHLKDIGHDGKTPDITYENAQARMRTMILMDKANMTGGIVLGTGDLSEIALGWSTYNGDHMSMFAVNNGVPKTVIRRVCAWFVETQRRRGTERCRKAADAVEDILNTPVSPELVKGQVTEDKIGPYELHDFFLWNFIMNEMGSRDLQKAAEKYFLGGSSSQPPDLPTSQRITRTLIEKTLRTFLWRFFTQAFKRNCQPDGIKVFPFELSLRGWWIPSDLGFVRI